MLSASEQYQLERINQARLDPLGEVARNPAVATLNQGLAPGTLDATPKQPLAPNALLTDAAEGHGAWLLQTNTFSHTGQGGSSIQDRIEAGGYSLVPPWAVGENLSWKGELPGPIDLGAVIVEQHDGLFESFSHRTNILNGDYREIGVSQLRGDYTHIDGVTYDSSMVVNKFGLTGPSVFLTGVAYSDTDGDGFYSIGEGTGGVGFAAQGVSTSTADSGGYGLQLTKAANVTVTVTFGAVTMQAAVDLSDQNVKLDLVDGVRLLSSGDLTLLAGASEAALLGIADISLTGNDAGNLLIGNAGSNALTGGAGNDTLQGGLGDDVLDGGGGVNTAVFTGNEADYVIDVNGDTVIVTDTRGGTVDEGANTLTRIQILQFADGSVTLDDPVDPDPVDPDPVDPDPVGPVTMAGQVSGRAGQDIAGARVLFTPAEGTPIEVQTDADGRFAMELPDGIAGRFDASMDWTVGAPPITTAMALEALRIAVGLNPSWGPASAMDMIAADITGDGRVTTADALEILRAAVGLESEHRPHWVFLDPEADHSAITRNDVAYETGIEIAAPDAGQALDVTALLVGQVQGFA